MLNPRKPYMSQPHSIENNSHKWIIVAEGDPSLCVGIVNYLLFHGYSVTGVGSAYDFYRQVFEEPYAVAIIDGALPDQSGLLVAEYARKNTAMRIITLSEQITYAAVPATINAGADINFVKPVDFRLLAASVANLFSRLNAPNPVFMDQNITETLQKPSRT